MTQTCKEVQELTLTRSFYPANHGTPQNQQLFAFADASDLAIAFAIYLRTKTTDGHISVSYVTGHTKVLPKGTSIKGQLSIPRAELCAAYELAKQVHEIETEIDIENLQPTRYFTDSQDVLFWINNTKDGFPRYITSRRQYIRKVSPPEQWQYISTEQNPADIGTRPISVEDLQKSKWLKGPVFLFQDILEPPPDDQNAESKPILFTAPCHSFLVWSVKRPDS